MGDTLELTMSAVFPSRRLDQGATCAARVRCGRPRSLRGLRMQRALPATDMARVTLGSESPDKNALEANTLKDELRRCARSTGLLDSQ